MWQNKQSVSSGLTPKETALSRDYFFLAATFFLGAGLAAGFLAVGFVAIMLIDLQVDWPAVWKFPRRWGHHAD
jgi:hypothetical protein